MKTMLSALGGFFDMLPGWLWALLLAGMALQSFDHGRTIKALKLNVATAQTGKAQADAALTGRIAAEAVAVATAVQLARDTETAARRKQDEKINELRLQNTAAAADLVAAKQRVRLAIYGLTPAGPGGADLPTLPGFTAGPDGAARVQFQAASGVFADRLLQLADEADQVVRERNTCAALYP